MKTTSTILVGILTAGLSAFGQVSARMEGLVSSDDGQALEGVVLRYRRVPRIASISGRFELVPGEDVVDGATASDARGTFTVSNLPAGDYVVCAEVPSAPYLDPCKWSASPMLTLSAGAVGRPAVVLRRGVFLRVRVNDPEGLLPAVKPGPMKAGNLIIGVRFGNGAFHGANITYVDGSGRDYAMVIPAGEPLFLWVFSRHVKLTDSDRSPVDNSGAMIPFGALAGQDQFFTLNVSGSASESK
ncbi:MAG: hypothetical protein KIT09_31320 [Bryobacteraceae bacterium]|nr:hypothetical protein [Bryobacteraceae bacterium]